ncbi:hypothetical protein [Leptospira bandrabouensis]|uniref:hypothetical protein n=1 Tax=Leptospira bandrabouensis TaxID=2484903 RepID=UPI001EE95893|nr:hypothetical protein [Leptospira bandrabouensis]MCG6146459.1 hypothetical protein [Leptospira bandrabouensis]MCG6161606.1 hypothetical protein [Leptospira bandrabouensis]MCG6166046.1 hypothetical protein [Leptospira bandrabouensis]
MEIEVKYQTCNLCDALHNNINDNFESVSFEILINGDIQTKIVLTQFTKQEESYITDLITEFAALQERDNVLEPIVVIAPSPPLQNVVYQLEPEPRQNYNSEQDVR